MKVISISTDRRMFEEDSPVRQRMVEYGKIFDELHIVVFIMKSLELRAESLKISDNVWIHPTNSKNKLFYIWNAFCIGKALSSKLLTSNCVISAQDPFETGLVGLLLKLRYKLPLQVQIHADFANRHFVFHSLLNFIRFPLGLFVLSFADSVRVVSLRMAHSIQTLANNISVLPIYSELKEEKKETRKDSKIKILTVSRLEKEKDLGTAIRAFKKLLDADIETTFTIVGDGGQRRSLELLAKGLKVESKVHFAGWQNDLSRYYSNADIYLSTSLYEGYGMSVVEAAYVGLPLVLSDAGVAGEIFRDRQEAIVCKPRNVESFAEALINLAKNADLRERMGESAKKLAEKNKISFREYLDQYKSSMQEALNFCNSGKSIFKKNILLRYFCAGITGASTQIGLLYIFTDIIGLWYIYSSVLSFVVAIVVSFILQKFWTFNDRITKKIHHQFVHYLGVALIGLATNTIFMYILVDIVGIWYILAQIITGGFIMIFNFLMYKFLVFRE